MTSFSVSRRVLAGGAAATAGIATLAAPVLSGPAAADPTDGTVDGTAASPQAVPAPGTYESCTAYFGLTKGNSDLVSYDVRTEGPVSPDPVLGTNLIPILTVQTSAGEVQCIPEAAWTDEASWASWIDWDLSTYTYPGTGYQLVPSPTVGSFSTVAGDVTVTSTSIRFETDIVATVSWTPAGPPATETGWFPFNGVVLTPTSNGVPEMLARIVAAGGDADAAALAEQILVDETCDDADPGLVSLADAMSVIYGGEIFASCGNVEAATWDLYRSTLFDVMVERSLIIVTLSNPTTTTTGDVAADGVVAPTFTG